MESITLGRSDLRVSRLGFGCWQLGGHGWGGIEQQEITSAIHEALAHGVNFFDTADVYGVGESETLLGEALRGKDAVISSKFGVRVSENGTYYDNSRAWLTQAVEGSLKRLKRDCIDLYFLHWHDKKRPLPDVFEDLEQLRAAGKIRWFGISNIDPLTITPPVGMAAFTLEYSLIRRGWEQSALAAERAGLGFLSWGSLAQGLLSGKYSRRDTFPTGDIRARGDSLFAAERWDAYEPLLAVLKEAAAQHGRSMAQVALRWVLDRHVGSVVLCGIKNRQQLLDNAGIDGWQLSAATIAALDRASEPLKPLQQLHA